MATDNIQDAFRIDKLSINDNILITDGILVPPSDGYQAPLGSLYFNDNTGNLYHKFGPTDYDWNEFGEIDAAAVFAAYKAPTGFTDRSSSQFSFNTSTLTFTIVPTSTSYTYYIKGTKYDITHSISVAIPNVTGLYYIYLDGTESLQYQSTYSDSILTDNCFVATVYWNATSNNNITLSDCRYGCNMDGQTRIYLYNVLGSRYISGLKLGGSIATNTNTDTAVQFSISNGSIRDDDLVLDIVNTGQQINAYDLQQSLTSIAQIPVLYRQGATGEWFIKPADNYPFIYDGVVGYTGVLIPINTWVSTSWELVSLSNNQFAFLHIFATNDIHHPIVAVHGSTSYSSAPSGIDQAYLELEQLSGSLPYPDNVPIASLIFQSGRLIGSTQPIVYIPTASGDTYIDWTIKNNLKLSYQGVSDHGGLTGLENDDHHLYALAGAGSTRTFDFGDLYNIQDITHAYNDVNTYGLTWDNVNYKYDVTTIKLSSLSDVSVTGSYATNKYALTWNYNSGQWIAAAVQTPLQLYNENPVSPSPPAAQGVNSVAIGYAAQTVSGASKSFAIGEQAVARIAGGFAQANGRFASSGDAQVGRYILRTNTVNNANVEAFMDGTNGTVRLALQDNSTWTFTATVTAHMTSGTNQAGFKIEGVIYRNSGTNTTSIQGSLVKSIFSKSDSNWDVNVVADTTHGSLSLFVSGDTGQIIRWVALVETVEVTN